MLSPPVSRPRSWRCLRGVPWLTACIAMVIATASHAGEPRTKKICADAYHAAQELRLEGKLTEAQRELVRCAQDACPAAVQSQCAKWLREAKESIPTVVFAAKDASGSDLTDVRVFVDGELVADSLAGRAVGMDPGKHTLRFEHGSEEPVELRIVVREGEKNRAVEVSFGADAAADADGGGDGQGAKTDGPVEGEEPGPPIGAFVIGGVGLAALGVFTGLAIAGTGEVDTLRDTCGQTSSCSDEEIDSARTTLIVGDVFLAAGVAAVGVGVGWLLVHYLSGPADEAAVDAAGHGLDVGVHHLPGGAAAVVRGAF